MESEPVQCPHYKRNCKVLAPCCDKWYDCNHCHDAINREASPDSKCKSENMKRTEVITIRCNSCQKEQEPSSTCKECEKEFSSYYCPKCKLWDASDNVFHCDDCGMCRRGKSEEQWHCFKCGICLNNSVKEKHKCMGVQDESCPICLETLFTSIKGYIQLSRCHHWIHVDCLHDYCEQSQTNLCPLCMTSLSKMKKSEIEYIDKMVEETKDKLPGELKLMKSNIICSDCLEKSQDVSFHFYGLKCTHCGSYNTMQT